MSDGTIVRVKDCEGVPAVFRGYIGIVKQTDDMVLVEFRNVPYMSITHSFQPSQLIVLGKVEGEL